jgi:CheY-like chemotaxis protein
MNTLLNEPVINPAARRAEPVAGSTALARRQTTVQSGARARILFVDDEPQFRDLGQFVLVRSGYEVNTAVDGTQGWEALQHAHYNLLITDNNMPGFTGLELAGRARVAGMRLPIMMISGSPSPMQDPAWARLDIAAFLSKPFAGDALVEMAGRVLLSANDGRLSDGLLESTLMRLARSIVPFSHGGINE